MLHSLRFGAVAVAFVLAAEAAGLFSPVIASPSGGTIQVTKSAWDYTQPASNPVSTVTNYAGLALSAMNGAFNSNKAAVCSAIKAKLTSANGMGKGFTAHPENFVCNPGTPPSSLDVSFSGGAFVIVYTITGNYLELTTTTPTVFGSYGDPRFSVLFNSTLTATIPVPTQTAPLAVTSVIGSISGAHLDSHNLPADLIQDLASVVAFFGGPNFQAMGQNALDSQSINLTSSVNTALGQLNLGQVSTQGFSQFLGSMTSSGGNTAMALLAQKPINVPTHGTASAPVIVEWTYGYGAPTGGCAALSASASVQVGPPSAGSPMSPAGTPGTGSGAVTQSGAWQQCAFAVSGLPTGLPIKLTAALNGGWNTTKYKVIGLAPYGDGPGTVTLGNRSMRRSIGSSGLSVSSVSPPAPVVFLLGVRPTGPMHSVRSAPAPFPTRHP